MKAAHRYLETLCDRLEAAEKNEPGQVTAATAWRAADPGGRGSAARDSGEGELSCFMTRIRGNMYERSIPASAFEMAVDPAPMYPVFR